jgi:hypothetical protein
MPNLFYYWREKFPLDIVYTILSYLLRDFFETGIPVNLYHR